MVLGFALRLEVVDGALAATRLFGKTVNSDIRSVDVALRYVYRGAAYVLFYGGLAFGIVACADFGLSLLAPGRINISFRCLCGVTSFCWGCSSVFRRSR